MLLRNGKHQYKVEHEFSGWGGWFWIVQVTAAGIGESPVSVLMLVPGILVGVVED